MIVINLFCNSQLISASFLPSTEALLLSYKGLARIAIFSAHEGKDLRHALS